MGTDARCDAHDLRTALAHYEAALDAGLHRLRGQLAGRHGRCSTWASRSRTASKSPERDSLYARAEVLARRAVAADSTGAEGHFALAAAVGRASLTMGKKDRIRRAPVIRDEARKAIELDPKHDGAYHILGRWNAEIMRLSGFSRFFAKSFLGAGIFKEASWDSATANLEKAVELDPETDLPPARAGPGLCRSQALRRCPGPARRGRGAAGPGASGLGLQGGRCRPWPGGSPTSTRHSVPAT